MNNNNLNKHLKDNYFKRVNKFTNYYRIIMYSLVLSLSSTLLSRLVSSIEGEDLKYKSLLIIVSLIGLTFIVKYILFIYKNIVSNRSVNYIDVHFNIIFFTSVVNLVLIIFDNSNYNKSWYILNLITKSLTLGIIIFRLWNTRNSKGPVHLYDYISLDNFVNNDYTYSDKKRILLSDSPSERDLLNRDNVITELYNFINNFNSIESLTLGLEGKWGSGKTTILNLVTGMFPNNDKNIRIITFNPWLYEDEKSMLEAMINNVLSVVSLGISSFKQEKMVINFINLFFAKLNSNILLGFQDIYTKNNDELVDLINIYLVENDVKLVFIIDNLDRTTSDHMYFVYKVISSILKLKKTLYILSYDENIVSKSLNELNFNYEYLDKIIHYKISIDLLNDVLDLSIKTNNKVLSYYDMRLNNNSEMEKVLKLIKKPRDISRVFNRIMSYKKEVIRKLNYFDLLAIVVIEKTNKKLYNFILSKFNILTGQRFVVEEEIDQIKTDINEIYYKEEDLDYIEILSKIFPKLNHSRNLYNENENKGRKISNIDNFPLFFLNSDTDNKEILRFNELVENSKDVKASVIKLRKLLTNKNSTLQSDYLSKLDLYNEDAEDEDYIIKLLHSVVENYYLINDYIDVKIKVSPRRLADIIIFKCLSKLSDQTFEFELNKILKEPKKLVIANNLNFTENVFRENIKEELLKSGIENIIQSTTDIFSGENLIKGNSKFIIEKYKGDNTRIGTYFKRIINHNNITLFLYDFLIYGEQNNKYFYHIEKKHILDIITDEEIVDMFKKVEKTTPNKNIILIYDKSEYNMSINFNKVYKTDSPLKLL